MKNVFGTLAVLAIVAVGAISGYLVYLQSSNSETPPKDRLEYVAQGIEKRIGVPFLKAWADRDLKQMALICRGEFAASVPEYATWDLVDNGTFEIKSRVCGEEQLNSQDDLEESLHYFFNPISDMQEMQTEFSISNLESVKGNDLWHCKVFLEARGINNDGQVKVYTNESFVLLSLPQPDSPMPASLRAWEFSSEVIRQSKEPIASELKKSLASNAAMTSLDVADFDNDNDQDIAITLTDGSSVVRGLFVCENGVYSNKCPQFFGALANNINPNLRTAWVDLDRNGNIDLVFGDRVFVNEEGKKFREITEEFFGDSTQEESASLGAIRRNVFR
jgi:hypothetical protein